MPPTGNSLALAESNEAASSYDAFLVPANVVLRIVPTPETPLTNVARDMYIRGQLEKALCGVFPNAFVMDYKAAPAEYYPKGSDTCIARAVGAVLMTCEVSDPKGWTRRRIIEFDENYHHGVDAEVIAEIKSQAQHQKELSRGVFSTGLVIRHTICVEDFDPGSRAYIY